MKQLHFAGILKLYCNNWREWPCYDEHLNHYLDQIEQKAKQMKLKLVCEPISRKQNKEAHQLATQALEGTVIDSHKEITE